MEMTTFTHGNAAKIELTEGGSEPANYGWGTEVYLQYPPARYVKDLGDVYPPWGPGAWCHIPMTNNYDSVGAYRWSLLSVMLQFLTTNCSIRHIHVYDGAYRIAAFEGYGSAYGDEFGLNGDFRDKPFEQPIEDRPKIFSALGISFYMAASLRDMTLGRDGDGPPSVTVTGAGVRLWRPNRLSLIFSDFVKQDIRRRYP
jgi:hypothetical protein